MRGRHGGAAWLPENDGLVVGREKLAEILAFHAAPARCDDTLTAGHPQA
jgi:hypothetical protein